LNRDPWPNTEAKKIAHPGMGAQPALAVTLSINEWPNYRGR
jgi:hypothetical protein